MALATWIGCFYNFIIVMANTVNMLINLIEEVSASY